MFESIYWFECSSDWDSEDGNDTIIYTESNRIVIFWDLGVCQVQDNEVTTLHQIF